MNARSHRSPVATPQSCMSWQRSGTTSEKSARRRAARSRENASNGTTQPSRRGDRSTSSDAQRRTSRRPHASNACTGES